MKKQTLVCRFKLAARVARARPRSRRRRRRSGGTRQTPRTRARSPRRAARTHHTHIARRARAKVKHSHLAQTTHVRLPWRQTRRASRPLRALVSRSTSALAAVSGAARRARDVPPDRRARQRSRARCARARARRQSPRRRPARARACVSATTRANTRTHRNNQAPHDGRDCLEKAGPVVDDEQAPRQRAAQLVAARQRLEQRRHAAARPFVTLADARAQTVSNLVSRIDRSTTRSRLRRKSVGSRTCTASRRQCNARDTRRRLADVREHAEIEALFFLRRSGESQL